MFLRLFLILILSAAAAISAAVTAQTPVPTPLPTPAPENETQVTRPEDLRNVPAVAPDYASEDRSFPDLGRVGVDMAEQYSLTLNEAIERALENNSNIEVSRKNVRIAEYDLAAARGAFQPRLTGETYFERATLPNISFFAPDIDKTTSNAFVGNAGVRFFAPKFGSSLDVGITGRRTGTDSPISIISPQYDSGLSFTFTQPLLRGRGFDQKRRVIEIAKRNVSLSDTQFRQSSIETVANVQRAYWDLVYALRNLQVQRDGTRDANEQLEHNRRMVEEGQLAPIDIVAAETQVAQFEQAVYDALNMVAIAENNLKSIITAKRTDAIWSRSITPVDPVEIPAPRISLTEAMTAALENRPEMDAVSVQKEMNAIDQKFFRNQTLPQVDIVAGYTSAGVGGALNPSFNNPLTRGCLENPTLPECVEAQQAQQLLLQNIGGSGTAFSDVFKNKYPTYRIGVRFDVPLFGDKTAKANLGRALVEGERLEIQREQIEQTIAVEVRNALQFLRTAEAGLRAASVARENSQKQYESEQRKLDAGQSDIYKVLERQTALTAARSAELRARTELNKAIADLQRATGNSLKANNVEADLK